MSSKLGQPLIKSLRETVLNAMESMAPLLSAEIKRTGTAFCNFYDLEIAVSTEPLITETCPALQDNEMAVFVKFTEKFKEELTGRPVRSILVGLCLAIAPNEFPFVVTRIWELYTPTWEGQDKVMTDPLASVYLKAEVLKSVETAIVDAAKRGVKEQQMKEDKE